jgi:hypothetical protein
VSKVGVLITPAITGILRQMASKKSDRALEENTTADYIIGLQDSWRKESDPENLRGQIDAILAFHQKENKFKALPERRRAEVADRLADAIVDENLDPGSLAYLIGEGRIFKNAKKGEFADDSTIDKAIADELKRYRKVTPFDLDTYYKDEVASRETYKKIMDEAKENRAEFVLLASLLPPEVVEDLTGMSAKELRQVRKRGHDLVHREVTQLVAELNSRNRSELEALGLNAKEIDTIRDLGFQENRNGPDTVISAITGGQKEKREVRSALATAYIGWRAKEEARREKDQPEAGQEQATTQEETASAEEKKFTEGRERRGIEHLLHRKHPHHGAESALMGR